MAASARRPIAVLGAGSWGTALAIRLARNGNPTRLWGHDPAAIAILQRERCHRRYLPGVAFPAGLQPEADLERAIADADDLLIAVPSHAFVGLLQRLAPLVGPATRIAWATKGLEPDSARLLSEVVPEILHAAPPLAVLSGPTFAREVATGMPTAVTVAADRPGFAVALRRRFHAATFRTYTSRDMTGVQLGGAVKNVLAIAAGIADGLGYGANARAALITRGLAEMMRLGKALGAQRQTFMGLAGLGDLVLTCTDDQSRNRRFGLALGRGEKPAAAQQEIGQVVEGLGTARQVRRLAARAGVEMPIAEQTYRVLHAGAEPRDAVRALLERTPKAESH
jgi:glycerol-3-phosphate dehydrogenase (NAD(P)+)